jgi:predicted ATPase
MSLEIATQLMSMAERVQDPTQVALAHWAMGWRLFFGGEFVRAKAHLEQAINFYNPQQHQTLAFLYGQDFGVGARSVAACTLWLLGYPDQARQCSQEATTLAQVLSHPMSLALAQIYAATLYVFCRDSQAAQTWAKKGLELSTRYRILYWSVGGLFCRGWALVEQGQAEEGIANIRQSLTNMLESGTKTCQTLPLAGLAEVYGKTGQVKAGLTTLAEALTIAQRTGECFYEAEIYRLKGELLLKQNEAGAEAEAESCFFEAIKVARRQQAKSLELRATMSLVRLWQRQGQQNRARPMLAEIYSWFSEGFDTADLQEARVLLVELG